MFEGNLRPVFLGMGVLASVAVVSTFGCGSSSKGGTGGTIGSGGTTTGSGGATTTGSGGATGTGGAAGAASTALPCTAMPTIPLITNFGTATGDGGASTNGSWGTTGQLTGTTFGYQGAMTNDAGVKSSVTAAIDPTMGTLTLSGTVNPADYAGGGMAFGTCVDSTMWTGVKFTLGGTANGCNVTFMLQTESQEPPANKGTCTASSCYAFPQVGVTIPTDGSATVIKFSDLMGTGMPSAPADFEKEMFGLQWQFTSAAPPDGGAQVGCNPAMTISDVEWVSSN